LGREAFGDCGNCGLRQISRRVQAFDATYFNVKDLAHFLSLS